MGASRRETKRQSDRSPDSYAKKRKRHSSSEGSSNGYSSDEGKKRGAVFTRSVKEDWSVPKEEAAWRPVRSSDARLKLVPKETEAGDSVMMSDAAYVQWAADAVVGDAIRTTLYDSWYFHSEHTAPGGPWRMQKEVECILSEHSSRKELTSVRKILQRVTAVRRALSAANRQKLKGLGVSTREARLEIQPGAHQQIVCPVLAGDLLFCSFHSETSPLRFSVELVGPDKVATVLSQPRMTDPKHAETDPQSYISLVEKPGDVVFLFSLPETSPASLLTVVVMKRALSSLIRSRNAPVVQPSASKYVCAACNFSRPSPPPGGFVRAVPCLLCDYVEGIPRTPHQAAPVPRDPAPPGVAMKPFACPKWYPSTKGYVDTFGTLFTTPPFRPLVNWTLPDFGEGGICLDVYNAPLPLLGQPAAPANQRQSPAPKV